MTDTLAPASHEPLMDEQVYNTLVTNIVNDIRRASLTIYVDTKLLPPLTLLLNSLAKIVKDHTAAIPDANVLFQISSNSALLGERMRDEDEDAASRAFKIASFQYYFVLIRIFPKAIFRNYVYLPQHIADIYSVLMQIAADGTFESLERAHVYLRDLRQQCGLAASTGQPQEQYKHNTELIGVALRHVSAIVSAVKIAPGTTSPELWQLVCRLLEYSIPNADEIEHTMRHADDAVRQEAIETTQALRVVLNGMRIKAAGSGRIEHASLTIEQSDVIRPIEPTIPGEPSNVIQPIEVASPIAEPSDIIQPIGPTGAVGSTNHAGPTGPSIVPFAESTILGAVKTCVSAFFAPMEAPSPAVIAIGDALNNAGKVSTPPPL